MALKGFHQNKKSKALYIGLLLLLVVPLFLAFRIKDLSPSSGHASVGPQKKPLQGPVVIVDPGHGGTDPGACREGVMEKDINLAIAKEMKKLTPDQGFQVRLTREKDMDFTSQGVYSKRAERYDLNQRIAAAHRWGGSIFISIHVNSGVGRNKGPEIYYSPQNKASLRLAEAIQQQLNEVAATPAKEPKAEEFYLFDHLNIPAVIVETGWLCNAEDCNKLQDPAYQHQLALAISQGIKEFVEEGN
ncbi:N-acetylmuramoyl-L-alanine amidase [Desulforamulus ruminis]|uniref:N-acetylmuramoyl-L-alanine amidase family protein n=1 Tax=Desulforamulus ruminis TaxID=1564 RepID=UPI002FDA2A3F